MKGKPGAFECSVHGKEAQKLANSCLLDLREVRFRRGCGMLGEVTVLSLGACGEKQGEIWSQQVCGESMSRIFSLVFRASALSSFQKVRGSERLSGK